MKIAKQPSEDELWKSIQSVMSCDTHLIARRSFEKVRQYGVSARGILTLRRKLLSDRNSVRFSHQSMERVNFRDSCPSLHVIETSSKHGRSTYARAFDQRDHRVKRRRRGVRKTQSIRTSHGAPENKNDTTEMSTTQT